MRIDFTGDPAIVAAVREGVRDALLDPRFGRELLLDLAGRFIYVTLDEAAEIVGHDVRTVRRWATANRVEWSKAFGDRQKRYRLGSIRAGMLKKTIAAKQPKPLAVAPSAPQTSAIPAPVPVVNGHKPATAAPSPLRQIKMLVRPATATP